MFGLSKKQDQVVLGVLGVVAAYFVYTNLLAGPDIPTAHKGGAATASGDAPVPVLATPQGTAPRRRAPSRVRSEEFHPVYLAPNPADRRDPMTIDPTLQLDRFAKVQSVELAGGARNVFQFGAPPAKAPELVGKNDAIVKPFVKMCPNPPPPPTPPPPPPPPPPITLKFYGYSTAKENGK